jgi:two-component system cell cycle response regulator CpdR
MSKNILVVEDEPVSLEFISQVLRKEGYRVSKARDGAEAIELLDNTRFDLVLTDIRMPRLDGVALAMHILSRLPTVAISEHPALRKNSLRSGWRTRSVMHH